MTSPARWTADELARRALLERGVAVAVNLRRHHNLIAWAKERRLFVRVDRATPWGNPFVIGRDGDLATVIARYRDHHLPSRPDLLARLGELRGRLGHVSNVPFVPGPTALCAAPPQTNATASVGTG